LTIGRVDRRLAAILAADVAGYSRLMGLDEEGTLALFTDHRRALIEPKIAEHRGRIVKTTGDGMLVEFASVVDAVRCAVEVQCGMVERNTNVPPGKRIEFRIGINVGDIIFDGSDIYGDGVNVAARLEALSDAGGVCVSKNVYDQIQNKLDIAFRDAGAQRLKNIERPVHIYHLLLNGPKETLPSKSLNFHLNRMRLSLLAGVLSLVVIGGGAGWWWHGRLNAVFRPLQHTEDGASRNIALVAAPPTVAVLPFLTLNSESAADYFGDGLTEDIISALGRFSELAVLARNTVFPYKGTQLKTEELGRALGARYLIEGSVRRGPDRIRVSVQLADATNGVLLWSTQYNIEPKDIFSIQDDITRQITGALAVKLTKLEQARAAAKPPNDLAAYDLVLRGRAMMSRKSRSANVEARGLFQRAIEIDASYAAAYVALGDAYYTTLLQGWTAQPAETLQRMQNLATTAIGLDAFNTGAHALLGRVYLSFRQYQKAIDELKVALDLNASDAETYSWLGQALLFDGAIEDSIKAMETALRFDPNLDVEQLWILGTAYFLAGKMAEATRTMEQLAARDSTTAHNHIMLAAVYAESGRADDAARAVADVRKLDPFFKIGSFGSLFRNPDHQAKIVSALRKAGL
jgi:adenylate cyclase